MFFKNTIKYTIFNKNNFYITFIITFLFAIISSGAQFIQSIYMGRIVNSINKEFAYVRYLFILIVITMLLEVFFNVLRGYITDTYCNKTIQFLHNKIGNTFVYARYSELEKENEGDLQSIVSNDLDSIRAYIGLLFSLGYIPVKVILTLVAIFMISWKLAICILVSLPIIILIGMVFSSKLYKLNIEENEAKGKINTYLLETIGFIKIIKTYNLQDVFKKRNNSYLSGFLKVRNKLASIMAGIKVYNRVTGLLPFIVLYLIGSLFVIKGEIFIGDIITIAFLIGMFTDGLGIIQSIMPNYNKVLATNKRLDKIMTLERENIKIKNNKNYNINENISRQLKFENVSFSYNKDSLVLKNVNFELSQGEKVLIIGKSGSGKTTLLKLISGLYEPTDGNIFLNGLNAKDIDLDYLRKKIAVVLQETFMFNDTIRTNITIGNKKISDERVKTVCEAVNINDFILGLEDSYNTIIKEDNSNFSKGQFQRMNIARALLKETDIYLFDEPTSALDAENHDKFYSYIDNEMSDKLVIVVSHKMDRMDMFDKVFYVDNGLVNCVKDYNINQINDVFNNRNSNFEIIKNNGVL